MRLALSGDFGGYHLAAIRRFRHMLDVSVMAAIEIFLLEKRPDAIGGRRVGNPSDRLGEFGGKSRRQFEAAPGFQHLLGMRPFRTARLGEFDFAHPARLVACIAFGDMRLLHHPVDAREHGLERGDDDVLVDADAEQHRAIRQAQFDIGDGRGIGAGAHRVLAIIGEVEGDAGLLAHRIDEARDRAVAVARDRFVLAVDGDLGESVCSPL